MSYQVINKRTSELKSLTTEEINDVDYDDAGRVVIFGIDGEAYFLIVDSGMIQD